MKLLETRGLPECRALIERGFGSYILQNRLQKKSSDDSSVIDSYRMLLQTYTLQGARDYFKLIKRLEKERRAEEFLLEKSNEADEDLVGAIADYMPAGTGLLLKNGDVGFFLGDVKWGNNNANSGFGMISKDGESLLLINKEHIKSFAEEEDSISSSMTQALLDLVASVSFWDEDKIAGCKRILLRGSYSPRILADNPKIMKAVQFVKDSKLSLKPAKDPGSLIKQRAIISDLEAELAQTAIAMDGAGDQVLLALRYAVAQKDPVGFINAPIKDLQPSESFAWRMFQNVFRLLQDFKALDGTVSTDLGQMVGSLTADNELWLALVLQKPSVISLSAPELGAVMCGVVTDGFKSTNAFFRQRPSEKVQEVFVELEKEAAELMAAQSELGIDFPVNLCREAGGLIEQWANGLSWRELCKETSLDQGDVCRMLRRTVEVLRQIPNTYGVNPTIANTAFAAVALMDRFPVADFDPNVDTKARQGLGFGDPGDAADDLLDEDSLYEDDEGDNVESSKIDDDEELLKRVEELTGFSASNRGGDDPLDALLETLDLR